MKTTLEPTQPDVIEVKTPVTRLLDLLAGWSEFVQSEEKAVTDHHVSVDELCELYQEAGQLIGSDQTLDQEKETVREFVQTRVLPTLLQG